MHGDATSGGGVLSGTDRRVLDACHGDNRADDSGAAGLNVTMVPFTVYVPDIWAPVLFTTRRMVPAFTEVASTGSLNVQTNALFTGTLTAPLMGLTDVTSGRAVSAAAEVPVAKLKVNGVAALAARSLTPLTVTL